MNPAHHGILALGLSLVACGVLYSLHRRSGQGFLLAWAATWALLAGYYSLPLLPLHSGQRLAQAAQEALMVLAVLSLLAMALGTPVRPRFGE